MQLSTKSEELTKGSLDAPFDLLVIGGGVNGAGVARDAVGRGFKVCLCESGDLASGTSSASTKLFHGGLRYLEYFEFNLVRKALAEREILLRAMPHISWPMRFVLPIHPDMKFDGETPVSKLLSWVAPWLNSRRPAWIIRLGLFLYDHLGGREVLAATRNVNLKKDVAGDCLKPEFNRAFEYSDCWVDDARLVVLNLVDAREKGAVILPRTEAVSAKYNGNEWQVELLDKSTGQTRLVHSRMIVNASGPWIDSVLEQVFGKREPNNVRLVRGSHIVVPRKFNHSRCYFFQNPDTRILFAIPYESDFTLIGTTDAEHRAMSDMPEISDDETSYLCKMASEYFTDPVREEDVIWSYSGVRALLEDGAENARAATRDYVIRRDEQFGEGSLINLFGGKITTYRVMSEAVLEHIEASLGKRGTAWTASVPLPGGDFPVDGFNALVADLSQRYPFLAQQTCKRLARQYGTRAHRLLGGARKPEDLGVEFGQGLYETEVRYLVEREWAQKAEDILYRRTKLGIHMSKPEIAALKLWFEKREGSLT